jgi:DNA-directed RNA polymerase subunit alpha
MENIFLPSKIEYKQGENENSAQLVIEPLWHGYGTTLGNALRRILLSSMQGAAVTAVKIKGANHEFQSVEGIMEDVLEICLNLKQLRLKVHSDQPVKLTLKKKGIGSATGADIEKNSDVEVANPDLHIAEISTKSGELDMEITVSKGMGFEPKESRDKSEREVGVIEIDAIYTPIKNVGYHVEDTRVGQITNYDKLTMDIETDGTITPQAAVKQASEILINHFNLLTTSN